MAEIRRYVLVDTDDQESNREFDTYADALVAARHEGKAVIAHVFELTDSELVWTPDGSDIWPPTEREAR